MKRKNLKSFVVILVCTICFLLSACSGNTESSVVQKSTRESTQSERVESQNDNSLSLMKDQDAELVGYWTQTVYEAEEDWREIRITLYLADPLSGAAYFEITDPKTMEYIARYEGTWICKDAEYLELDLTCTENYSGLDFYDKPIKGTYFYVKSDYEATSLTLTVEDEKTTPLYTGHAYEPITLLDVAD